MAGDGLISYDDLKSYLFYSIFEPDKVYDPKINQIIMDMRILSIETALEEKKRYIDIYLHMVPFYFGLYKKCCMGNIYRLRLSNGNSVILDFKKKYCMHLVGLDYQKIKDVLYNYSEELKLDKDVVSKMTSDQIMEYVCSNVNTIIDVCNSKTDFIDSFFNCISDYGFKKLHVIRYLSEKLLTDFSKCFVVKNPNDSKKSAYAVIHGYKEFGEVVINGIQRTRVSCIAFCVGIGVNAAGKKFYYLSSSRYFEYKDDLEFFIKDCEISFVKGYKLLKKNSSCEFDVNPIDSIKMITSSFPEKNIAANSYLKDVITILKKYNTYGMDFSSILSLLNAIELGKKNFINDSELINKYNAIFNEIIRLQILLDGADVECNYLTDVVDELNSQIADYSSKVHFLQKEISKKDVMIENLNNQKIYCAINTLLRLVHGISIEFKDFEHLLSINPNVREIVEYIDSGKVEFKGIFDKFIDDIIEYVNTSKDSVIEMQKMNVTYKKRSYKHIKISPKVREVILPIILVNSTNRRIINSSISKHSAQVIRSGLAYIDPKCSDVLYRKFAKPDKKGTDIAQGLTPNVVSCALSRLITYLKYYDVMFNNIDSKELFDVINELSDDRARLIMLLRYGFYNSRKYSLREINEFLRQIEFNPKPKLTTLDEIAKIFNDVYDGYRKRYSKTKK